MATNFVPETRTMRILVVDDHELVRKGICSVLATEPAFTVCGEAVDGRDAVAKAKALLPDVVVMDVSMPNMDGLEATREIKRFLPDTEIVVVSQIEAPEMVRHARNAGAGAYIVKTAISTDLLTAIARVGQSELSAKLPGAPATGRNLTSQQILERSAAFEKAFHESEERFRAVMNNMAEGLYTVDTHGLVTYVNPSAEAIFGWTSEELLGKKMHDVTHYKRPDGRPFPAGECPGLQVLEKGIEIREREDAFIRKDGSFFPVMFSASPLKYDGKAVGVVVCFRDDTKRREAEAAVQLRGAIVDSSDDAIISKNMNGVITSWNSGAESMFGHSAKEAIGQHITLIIPPDRRSEEDRILEQLRLGNRVEHLETVRMRKDGSLLNISATISPIKDTHGRVMGASKVARNITERMQTERDLRESEERLRTLAGQLDLKVRVRTRELEQRNAEILRQSEQLRELSGRLMQTQDEERRRIARELHDGVGQLLAAMSMNFSKIDRADAKLAPEVTLTLEENVALVETAAQEIRTISYLLHPPLLDEVGLESALRWYVDGFAERSNIKVHMELAPGFSERMSRDLALSLFRVVQESLTNIHRHSGSATAFVGIAHSSEEIRLEVKDEGKGIPRKIQSKISSGQRCGVGLSGMRERIRQLGGRFEVDSNGGGTRITAVLPISAAAGKTRSGLGTYDNAADEMADGMGNRRGDRTGAKARIIGTEDDVATILCIDDEAAGLVARKLLLESAGHRVIEARSGEEGIELFKSEKVDAVILDYWMSGMKGTAVASELKRISPVVPIIMVSGMSDLPGEVDGLVDQWIIKGTIRAEELLESISAVLERRPA